MALSSSLLSEHCDHPALGVWTFIGNLLLMALISAAVRELVNRDYPLSEVLLLRYLFASGFFWIILLSTAGLAGLATQRPLDHAIRSISGIVSLALLYFAITRIPIADATAIAYAAPIFITVLSIYLLGEVIGLRRWLAVVAGFVGVLLIARPEVDGWDIGVIAAAGSAFHRALLQQPGRPGVPGLGVTVGMVDAARGRSMVVPGVRAWLRHATMVVNGVVSLCAGEPAGAVRVSGDGVCRYRGLCLLG